MSIVHGDCLQVMKEMEDGCVDLVVTSPPYNIRNTTGGFFKGKKGYKGIWKESELIEGYDEHEDSMPHDEYVKWQRSCLDEMMRLIPDTGAIFYNHKWRVQGGLIQDRQDIVSGFPVRQIIIWQRGGGVNFNNHYFLPTYEVIYLIAKPKFKLLPTKNKYGDVWSISHERGNTHPAPFPEELSDRIISSTDARVILDPFVGSGTVAVSAIKLGREYIGIDVSKKYCNMANERIDQYKSQQKLML